MLIFVSDVHLKIDKIDKNYENFCYFLRFLIKKPPEKFYILGDLLDGWYHNDYINTLPHLKVVRDLLRELAVTTKIFIMKGNHDFIIDEFFCSSVSATLIKDRFLVINDGSKNILLTHGDLLFEIKFGYRISLIFQVIIGFLSRNLSNFISEKTKLIITNIFKGARDINKNLNKDYKLKLNHKAIKKLSEKYYSTFFIFGHSHKADCSTVNEVKLCNLGSWDKPFYLEIKENKEKLINFN